MAEVRKSYPKLQEEIENSIKAYKEEFENNENYNPLPDCFEAAVLASLSEKIDDNTTANHQETYELWSLQLRTDDQLAFGKYFVSIQDVILEIIKNLIKKGTMATLIEEQFLETTCTPIELIEFINTILKALRSLDGCDICLAYKGSDKPTAFLNLVNNNDIKTWFPSFNDPDGLHECDMASVDMHYSCCFFNHEDLICTITQEGMVESVNSLKRKGIIVPPYESETYRFKW